MSTRLLSAVALLFVIAGAVIFLAHTSTDPLVAERPATSENLLRDYTNASDGFSLRLPAGYIVDEFYHYQELGPGKEIAGTKFSVATATTDGTNLGADTYISIEQIPHSKTCSATFFLESAAAQTLTEGNTTYSTASTTGATAGNRYEETVYVLPHPSPCVAVRYFIHYGNFGNYETGTVREFDTQALLKQFDSIRRSLTIQ